MAVRRVVWGAICALMVVFGASDARAQVQVSRTYVAEAASLGAIPNGSGVRAVQFTVGDAGVVRALTLSLTLTHSHVGDLSAVLISPDGKQHDVFWWGSQPSSSVDGTYTFSDAAFSTFFYGAFTVGTGRVPPGTYLTHTGAGVAQSLTFSFNGRISHGTWYLQVRDQYAGGTTGTVSAASLTLGLDPGWAAVGEAASLGAIPDGVNLGNSARVPGAPLDVRFTVPAGAGTVRRVRVSMTLTHSWVGDLSVWLIAPDGTSHPLFGNSGLSSMYTNGSTADLNGTYDFDDSATGQSWWTAVQGTPVPPGVYQTSTIGADAGGGGVTTSMNAALAGVPAAGTWTLRVVDSAYGDTGFVSAARLTLVSTATPTTVADTYGATYATALAIPAPGVLANDVVSLGPAMTAQLVSPPANGTLSLASSGAVSYTPRAGFIGTDTFTYRATNADGPGNVAAVSIVVSTPTTVQPPLDVRASTITGNTITLRWTPAPGPMATSFLMEGGVAPGQVLASIPTGSPLPIITFDAPAGVFYLRVRAVAAGVVSGVSNEIRVFVQTPAVPSAPDSLTGVVNGDAVNLSWRNTFGGGAPTSQQLVVTGASTAVLPLPLGESFAFAGVPGGSYSFRVRAVNASGASLDSNAVTLTFPTSCAGAPAPPPNFLAYAVGNVVHLLWDPPAIGAAPATSYVVTVGGSLNAAVPMATRTISAPLPGGAYTFSVASTNACGTGASTATQTVFIP